MAHAPAGPEPSLCFGVREHVSSRRVRYLSARQIATSSFCECACWLLLPLSFAPSHTCAEAFLTAMPFVNEKPLPKEFIIRFTQRHDNLTPAFGSLSFRCCCDDRFHTLSHVRRSIFEGEAVRRQEVQQQAQHGQFQCAFVSLVLQPASFACAGLPLRISCAVQQTCKPPSLSRLLSPVAFRLSLAALICLHCVTW